MRGGGYEARLERGCPREIVGRPQCAGSRRSSPQQHQHRSESLRCSKDHVRSSSERWTPLRRSSPPSRTSMTSRSGSGSRRSSWRACVLPWARLCWCARWCSSPSVLGTQVSLPSASRSQCPTPQTLRNHPTALQMLWSSANLRACDGSAECAWSCRPSRRVVSEARRRREEEQKCCRPCGDSSRGRRSGSCWHHAWPAEGQGQPDLRPGRRDGDLPMDGRQVPHGHGGVQGGER